MLLLPIERQRIKNGKVFAASLRTLLSDKLLNIGEQDRATLASLADRAETHHLDHRPRKPGTLVHPCYGLLGKTLYFAALIPHREQPELHQWLRVALTLWLISPDHKKRPLDITTAEQLAHLLTANRGHEGTAFAAVSTAIEKRLRSGLIHTAKNLDTVSGFTALSAEKKHLLKSALTTILQQPVAAEKRKTTTTRPKRSHHLSPQFTRQNRGHRSGLAEPLRRGGIPHDDLFDGSSVGLLSQEGLFDDEDAARSILDDEIPVDVRSIKAWEDQETAFQAQAVQYLHLEGALIPDTDRSLTFEEACISIDALMNIAADRRSRDPVSACAALLLVLSALTSRPWRLILSRLFLRDRLTKSELEIFDASEDGFITSIPETDDFANADEYPGIFRTTRRHCSIPFPKQISDSIWKTKESGSTPSFALDDAGLAIAIEQLVKEIQQNHSPRFTQTRIWNLLPVSVVASGHHPCTAQILCGQDLWQSTARLHYYALPDAELVGIYAAAVKQWLPENLHLNHNAQTRTDTDWVGAPFGALKSDMLRKALKAEKSKYVARMKQATTTHDHVQAFNALARWTAGMFAAGTGHRQTFRLTEITFDDLVFTDEWPTTESGHPAGFSINRDKLAYGDTSYRPSVLAPLLCEQLRNYHGALHGLIETLSADINIDWEAVTKTLNKCLQGRYSLFVAIDTSGPMPRCRRLRRGDVQLLLQQSGIPVTALRHRLLRLSHEAGIHPMDSARQMGHSLGFDPFDVADPDSPPEFLQRIADRLDTGLGSDGWEALAWSKSSSQNAPYIPTHLKAAAAIALHNKIETRSRKRTLRRRQDRERYMKEKSAEINELVDSALSTLVPDYSATSPPENISIDIAKIQELCGSLDESVPDDNRFALVLRQLRNRLKLHNKKHKWQAALPPLIHDKVPAPLTFSPGVPRAWHIARRVLVVLEGELLRDANTPLIYEGPGLAFLVAELVLRGGVTDMKRLIAILRNLNRVTVCPFDPHSVLIDIPASIDLTPDDEEPAIEAAQPIYCALRFTGLPALLLHQARDHAETLANVDVFAIERALETLPQSVLDTFTKGSRLRQLIAIGGLARRLTQSGIRAAWEDGRLTSQTLNSDRLAELAGDLCAQQRQPPPPADAEPHELNRDRTPLETSSLSITVLKQVRSRLHEVAVDLRGQVAHETISNEIRARLDNEPELDGTARVLLSYLLWTFEYRKRNGDPLELTTIYGYYTTLLMPLVDSLNGRDFLTLSEDELQFTLHQALRHSLPQHHGKRFRQLQNLLTIANEFRPMQVDVGELADDLNLGQMLPCAYLLTYSEYLSARTQLLHWAQIAERMPPNEGLAFHPIEFRAAAVMLTLLFRLGARIGEISHLRMSDILWLGTGYLIFITRRRIHSLKTLSAKRPLRTEGSLDDEETRIFEQFLDDCRRLLLPADRSPYLFRSPLIRGGVDGQRLFGGLLSDVLDLVTDDQSSRSHACRHSRATAGLASILSEQRSKPVNKLTGLPRYERPASTSRLVPGHSMMHFARTLGHGSTTSTLSFYVHLIAILNSGQDGYGKPNYRIIAFATGVSYDSLRKRLSRYQLSASSRDFDSIVEAAAIFDQSPAAGTIRTLTCTDHLPARRAPAVPAEQLVHAARILRDLLRGVGIETVGLREGVPAESLQPWIQECRNADYRYGTRLMQDLGTSTTDRKRGPKMNEVLRILARLDTLRVRQPDLWRRFTNILQSQPRLEAELVVNSLDDFRIGCTALAAGLDASAPHFDRDAPNAYPARIRLNLITSVSLSETTPRALVFAFIIIICTTRPPFKPLSG